MSFLQLLVAIVVLVETGGITLFDPKSEICCGGKVHSVQSKSGSDDQPSEGASSSNSIYCCDQEAYDASLNICCKNTVLAKPEANISVTVSCCGSALYDFRSALCCQETVIEFPVAPANWSSDVLLDQEFHEEASNASADDRLEEVAPTSDDHQSMLCCPQTREGFDWRLDMCCHQGVKPRPFPHSECCGSSELVYDVRSSMCCGDAVVNTEGSNFAIYCCGDEGYDRYTSLCCNGKVKSKPDPEREYRCCSGEIYDTVSELCCPSDRTDIVVRKPEAAVNTSAVPRCCGTGSYDPEAELCCAGTVHRLPPMDDATGSDDRRNIDEAAILSPDSGATPRRSSPSDHHPTECCGSRVYSRSAEMCCGGVIHSLVLVPRSGGASAAQEVGGCCGEELLKNPNYEICCENKTVSRRSIYTRCCGKSGNTFESNREICCDSTVLAKGGNEQCCGDTLYNFDSHVCCVEAGRHQLMAKQGRKTACCSGDI